MPEKPDAGCIEREMGLDHADFWRLLPRAVDSLAWHGEGRQAVIEVGSGTVEIELGEERVRRIALMAIPVTPVTIRWQGIDAETFASFLERFDSHYRRGGG
jgi:hypothetical protein